MTKLDDDFDKNFDIFIEQVIKTKQVWGLQDNDGWAVCASNIYEHLEGIPFWSDKAFASVHCCDEWANYKPVNIDLASFIDHWLVGMYEDGMLAGINWNNALRGHEIDPEELADNLMQDED